MNHQIPYGINCILMISIQSRCRQLCMWTKTQTLNVNHISQHAEEEQEWKGYVRNCRHSRGDIALVALLKTCAKQRDLCKGSKLHAHIAESGLHKNNIFIGSSLVTMYAKCGALAQAQQVFDELPAWDVVSWTALIAGYAEYGQGEKALTCFEYMQHEGLSPDAFTFACILKACGSLRAAERGKELHAKILRRGLHERNDMLCTALLDMYAKCGAVAKAQQVFNELATRDVVSWTALIMGYCQHGLSAEALNCFEHMKHEGLSPNAVMCACILSTCGMLKAAESGKAMHTDIVRKGLMENDTVLGVALVDMYAKCGAFAEAKQVLGELAIQDTALWNALITGYCQHGHSKEALNTFAHMKHEGCCPDEISFVCVLKACGSIGAAEKGKEIHGEIVREGWLEKSSVLGSALVDMYVRCGALSEAQEVFDKLPLQDLVSWTALIAGYCQHGHCEEALNSFQCMMRKGLSPDVVTFACILKTCSRIATAEKGQMYFEAMTSRYGIIPMQEHHTCMVDLFGRWGHFDKAVAAIRKMPSSNYLPAWYALMGACQKWGNVELGRFVFEHAVELDATSAVAYVCMSSIYAAAGMQDEADKIKAMKDENKAWKKVRRMLSM